MAPGKDQRDTPTVPIAVTLIYAQRERVFLQPQRRVKPPPASSGWFVRITSPAVGLNA
jgi:hypothetical protein